MCFYFDIKKEKLWGSNFDVRNCSTTIDGATKFSTYQEALDFLQENNISGFDAYPICPKCGHEYYGYPSISRKDNKTEICDKCGLTEALNDFFKYEKEALN